MANFIVGLIIGANLALVVYAVLAINEEEDDGR